MWADGFPLTEFLLATLPGIALGWGLRWLVRRAGLKRDGEVESRYERLMNLLGTFTQSLAIGLAMSFLALVLATSRFTDPRLIAGLTFLTAVISAFLAAFLRALFRRISN